MSAAPQTSNIHTLVVLVSVCVVCICLEQFTNVINHPKQFVTWITLGIQRVANGYEDVLRFSNNYLSDRNELLQRIDELEGEIQQTSAENSQLRALEESNVELREILGLKLREPTISYVIAELAAPLVSPARDEVTLNRGLAHGIKEGAAVLDASGVFGQVVEVLPYTSRVFLITDKRIAVPVRVERSGLHAVLTGVGDSKHLTLEHVEATADLAEGDLLITSGLGGIYPYGYPVGLVTSLEPDEAGVAVRSTIEPLAELHRRRFILIVTGASYSETPAE
ncbi:MAG: rod shape-determining protein MreC [Gammaproteobacteria bacterium]|nr:rod shape-determining protein MreC [Gammaproteobacteria bacterium]MYF37364.1 rod shape-determining protein MreC [Gammaproteobacteria bacterium]